MPAIDWSWLILQGQIFLSLISWVQRVHMEKVTYNRLHRIHTKVLFPNHFPRI